MKMLYQKQKGNFQNVLSKEKQKISWQNENKS